MNRVTVDDPARRPHPRATGTVTGRHPHRLRAADDRPRRRPGHARPVAGADHRRRSGPAHARDGRLDPGLEPRRSQLAFLRAQDGPGAALACSRPPAAKHADSRRSRSAPALRPGAPTARASRSPPQSTARRFPTRTTETILARRSAPASTDRLGYKADGAGTLGTLVQQLHVLDVDSGKVTVLTRGRSHASDPFWSPDGTLLAYSASVEDDADLTMRIPEFVRSATDPNSAAVQVSAADVQATAVGWTPDGRHVVAAGRTDTEVGNADLLLFPVDGGEPQNITRSLDRNVMPGGSRLPGGMPQFTDGGDLVFCLRDNGYSHVYRVAPDGSGATALVDGTANVSGLSVAASSAAITLATPESFGDIAVLDLTDGSTRVLTDYGTPAFDLLPAEERRFTIADGTVVTGWLRRDPDAAGPLPLLLRCARRSAQRLERCRRPRPPVPPGGSRAAAGRSSPSTPARQRRLRRRVLLRGLRWVGRQRRERLPRADRPARRRGHRRPGPTSRDRIQLRRLHDLFPHVARRPLRGGRGRRRGHRSLLDGRHLRLRALPLGEGERRAPLAR